MLVVLPTPPFWLATVITRRCAGLGKAWSPLVFRTRTACAASRMIGVSKPSVSSAAAPTASSSTLRIRVRLASSSVTFSSSLLSPSSECDSPPSRDPNHPTGPGLPSTGSTRGVVRIGQPTGPDRWVADVLVTAPALLVPSPARYPSSRRSPSPADRLPA